MSDEASPYVFSEVQKGFSALQAEREGKLTLKRYSSTNWKLPKISPDELREGLKRHGIIAGCVAKKLAPIRWPDYVVWRSSPHEKSCAHHRGIHGITVHMWHDDHPPPHVHVSYQGHEAEVKILTGVVIAGQLPSRIAAVIKHWCLDHQHELLQNWQKAQRFEPLTRIEGVPR